ncbi:MAG: urease accessory protein UreE [Actinomycetaceae bacterium]|nr:urease accessory protein UreE [Actinomycetaceae bacterium]
MIVSEISGNVADLSASERATLNIDYVSFDNEARMKRVQRVQAESGKEIALRFALGFREVRDGDILVRDGDEAIVVKIDPTDVLVIKPRTIREMGVVAHTLGNRHMQAQFFDENSHFGQPVMVVRYDHTVEHYLEHVEVPFERGDHVMPEAFRHAEHTH